MAHLQGLETRCTFLWAPGASATLAVQIHTDGCGRVAVQAFSDGEGSPTTRQKLRPSSGSDTPQMRPSRFERDWELGSSDLVLFRLWLRRIPSGHVLLPLLGSSLLFMLLKIETVTEQTNPR